MPTDPFLLDTTLYLRECSRSLHGTAQATRERSRAISADVASTAARVSEARSARSEPRDPDRR